MVILSAWSYQPMSTLSNEIASECVTRAEFEKLVRRVAKLERANKPAPKKNPSVGIYYRDGKPMKGKPKEQG
jgi:hypothetical protein